MGGRTRAQSRTLRDDVIDVFPAETSLGWRVIRVVSVMVAAEKLARGEWRQVYDEFGNFVGCQVLASFQSDLELPSGATATSITALESQLNAGCFGRSRTVRMSEEDRISRHSRNGKALPPEDAIERAIAKLMEFGKRRLLAKPVMVTIADLGGWDAFPALARLGP